MKNEKSETYMITVRKVRQLCPAPAGLLAVYREDGGTGFTLPVIAIALTDEWDEERDSSGLLVMKKYSMRAAMAGVLAGEYIGLHEDNDNLVGYLAPDKGMEEVYGLKVEPEEPGALVKDQP